MNSGFETFNQQYNNTQAEDTVLIEDQPQKLTFPKKISVINRYEEKKEKETNILDNVSSKSNRPLTPDSSNYLNVISPRLDILKPKEDPIKENIQNLNINYYQQLVEKYEKEKKQDAFNYEILKSKFQNKLTQLEGDHNKEISNLEKRYNDYIANIYLANEIKSQKLKIILSNKEEQLERMIFPKTNQNYAEINKKIDDKNMIYFQKGLNLLKELPTQTNEFEQKFEKRINEIKLIQDTNLSNSLEKRKLIRLINSDLEIEMNLQRASAIKQNVGYLFIDFFGKICYNRKQLELERLKKIDKLRERISKFDSFPNFEIPNLFSKEDFTQMKSEIKEKGVRLFEQKSEFKSEINNISNINPNLENEDREIRDKITHNNNYTGTVLSEFNLKEKKDLVNSSYLIKSQVSNNSNDLTIDFDMNSFEDENFDHKIDHVNFQGKRISQYHNN